MSADSKGSIPHAAQEASQEPPYIQRIMPVFGHTLPYLILAFLGIFFTVVFQKREILVVSACTVTT
jgi:hypothetical protein